MFERRLYFHVDWLLLGAILVIAGIGIAMIYSTTYVTLPDGAGHAGPQVRTQVYALVLGLRRAPRLPVARLPDARRAFAVPLRRARASLLLFVLVEGLDADGRAALDPDRPVQPAALGVRPRRRSR